MKSTLKLFVAALVLTGASLAKASANDLNSKRAELSQFAKYGFTSESDMQNYFTIDSVEIVKGAPLTRDQISELLGPIFVPSLPLPPPMPGTTAPGTKPTTPTVPTQDPTKVISDIAGVDISAWITLGEKIWSVIVANKPVANVSTQRVAVLPVGLADWSQMEHWQGPAVDTYTVQAKNLYGATVISHTYVIARNYGGQLNGKGAFLANTTVVPTTVEVSWGFTLNSQVEVGQTINMGSKEDPKPALDLQLQWKMDSVLKHLEGRDSFFVKGDGSMMHITAGH